MVIVIKTLETPKNIKAKGSSSDYIKSRVINGDNKKWIEALVYTPGHFADHWHDWLYSNRFHEKDAGIRGNYHESSDCSLLKSSYPKKYLPKKKPRNQKFQTQKNPSINHVNWNPEYPHWVGHNVPTREISAVETNPSFIFNLNNSQNVYKQISSLFTKHFEWTHLSGRHVLSRWQGIMGFLVLSPPRCAVPVLDTLCLSSMRCAAWLSSICRACPRYAVPFLNTPCLS